MNRRPERVTLGGMRAAARLVLPLLAWAGLAAAGCGGDDPAISCPNDQPAACPSPEPSFSGQVAAIIQSRCAVCHAPGGQEPTRPFQTYAQISAQRGPILNQVSTCRMPLAGATPLTDEERQALLGWLVCRAPDN
jgi:uncharacterized membrane protein